MEVCTCEAVCPCIVLNDPTEGTCTAVVAWHIDEGRINRTALDDRVRPEQQEALGTIFGGEAGGHPANLAEFISEVRGVEAVPLTFETDGKRGTIRVGRVGEAEAEPIEGPGGETPTLRNPPLAVAPGYPLVVARTNHGIAFDVSGRSALISTFSYAGL